MKLTKEAELEQMNARVRRPLKEAAKNVARRSRLPLEAMVDDALAYYLGWQDKEAEDRRAYVRNALKALYGDKRPFEQLVTA